MNIPCKDCDKRYLGCHSKCKDYFRFKVLMARADRKRKAEEEAFVEFKSYKKDRFKD